MAGVLELKVSTFCLCRRTREGSFISFVFLRSFCDRTPCGSTNRGQAASHWRAADSPEIKMWRKIQGEFLPLYISSTLVIFSLLGLQLNPRKLLANLWIGGTLIIRRIYLVSHISPEQSYHHNLASLGEKIRPNIIYIKACKGIWLTCQQLHGNGLTPYHYFIQLF